MKVDTSVYARRLCCFQRTKPMIPQDARENSKKHTAKEGVISGLSFGNVYVYVGRLLLRVCLSNLMAESRWGYQRD
jgi:hypothetical protein